MSNFIEIKIGGKVRAFRFGLGSIGDMQDHLDVDLKDLLVAVDKNPFKTVPIVLYYAHKFETEDRGKIVDFTVKDFGKWIEERENTYADEDITSVLTCFIKSLIKYVPGAKDTKEGKQVLKKVDDDPKKKLTGT